ncbi:MAG: hypothetical protein H0V84_01610 [Actinobacteria bacterium]|nr:hypothetical protein [Actinomycetota bacterium]
MKVSSSSESGKSLLLVGRVPAARVASIAVEQAGASAPLAERRRSGAAPRVKVATPVRVGSRPSVTVRWTATDADGGRLLATIEYSANSGRSWKTVSVGPSRGNTTLPSRFFTASRRARVRIRVSDGFNETVAVTGPFRSLGAPPEARILAPRPGTRVTAGALLVLEGVAFDDAGRRLSGGRLRWLDGRRVLGRGDRLNAPVLTPGRRRIVLEATDALGRRSRSTVTVRVAAVKPLFRVLEAPARLSRRARRVSLRVAATVPATLTIAGRRFPVGLRVRSLALPIRPGRSPLRLSLRLVSGGKVTTARLTILRR